VRVGSGNGNRMQGTAHPAVPLSRGNQCTGRARTLGPPGSERPSAEPPAQGPDRLPPLPHIRDKISSHQVEADRSGGSKKARGGYLTFQRR